MQKFEIANASGRSYSIGIEEVTQPTDALLKTLIDIDLQTFTESTFSHYTAAAFFHSGRIFLLKADDVIIGTCACMRTWERPNEVHLLSMGIRPGWRGRGLGHRFLRFVLERLGQRGIRALTLLVSENNLRALKLYREVGFESQGTVPTDTTARERFVTMTMRLRTDPLAELPQPEPGDSEA